MALIYISLVANDVDHLFMCNWLFFHLLCRSVYSALLSILSYLLFVLLLLSYNSYYSLDNSCLLDTSFANFFSHLADCLCTFLMVSFEA